jgi:hypothetical protein
MRVRYQAPVREVPKWQAPAPVAPLIAVAKSALAPARVQPAAKRSSRKTAHEQWPQAIVRPVPASRGRGASQPAFRFTPAGAAAATCALLAAAGCATIEPQASKAWKIEPVLDVRHTVQSAQGYYQLGRYYDGMRAWDKSIDAYRKAIAAEPSHVEARNGLAVALAQRGRYAESEAAFRETIALSPDSSHLRSNLGYVLLLAGKPQEAVRELRAAVKADKTDVTAIANLREAVWQLESARLAGTVTDKVMPAAPSTKGTTIATTSPAPATDASKQQAPAAVAMPVPAAEAQPRSLAHPVPAVAAEAAPAVPPSNALMVSVAAPITTASVPAPIVTSLNVPAPLVTAVVPSPAAPIAVVTAPTVPSLEQPAPVAVASTPVAAAPAAAEPMAVQVFDKPTVPSLQAAPATGPITQAAASMIAAAPAVEAASTRPAGLQWSAAEPAKPATEPVKQRVAAETETPRPAAVVVKAAVAPLAPAARVTPPAPVHESRLELSNGNGVTGMAARLRSWLSTQGVKTSRLTNDLPYNQPQTVIQYRHGHEQAAMQIAQALPAATAQTSERSDLSSRTDVRVLIGRDWVQMASCLNDKTVCSPHGTALAQADLKR